MTDSRWATGKIDGHWYQGRVTKGRITRLVIAKGDTFDPAKPLASQAIYNYDRKLDFDRCKDASLPERTRNLILKQP